MSASSSCPMVGWEFAYKLVEKDLIQKSDVMILLIHWVLILENNFKCIGLGSEKTLMETDKENSSDLLPDGWNQYAVYLIRYIKNDLLYVLTGSKSNDLFIVNFLHVQTEIASNIVINIEEAVKDIRGPITNLFENHQELVERIRSELVDAPSPIMKINPTRSRYNLNHLNTYTGYGCGGRSFRRTRNNRRLLRRPKRVFHRTSRHIFATNSRYSALNHLDNERSVPPTVDQNGDNQGRARPYERSGRN